MKSDLMHITECPRDAMQGISRHIPSPVKASYINSLMKVGFDIIDFGSFVSHKAIPQMADTLEVLEMIETDHERTKLLAIVGNLRGAEMAAGQQKIDIIGFPWSVSEKFLELNINTSYARSIDIIDRIAELAQRRQKRLIIYISMAYGNPYGERWEEDMLLHAVERLRQMGISCISLSDTIGVAEPEVLERTMTIIINEFPDIDFGLHLHSTLTNWYEKIDVTYRAGCRRYDGVINGLGGCPMAGHQLVGNLNTRLLLEYCQRNNIKHHIDTEAFDKAYSKALSTFSFLAEDHSLSNVKSEEQDG